MVNLNDNGSVFYTTKVTFLDSGVEHIVYTDSPSMYETMGLEYKDRITNMKVETFIPSEEQVERLKLVNKLAKGYNVEGFGDVINRYVEHGYLDESCPEYLLTESRKTKTKAASKEYLIKVIKKRLSSLKTDKEKAGCMFMDCLIQTDPESQAKITGTLMMMNTGLIPSVDFKTKNGFINLDATQFQTMAVVVATHVQICFKAESIVIGQLDSKPIDELAELSGVIRTTQTPGSKQQENVDKLEQLYNNTYDILMKKATEVVSKPKAAKSK